MPRPYPPLAIANDLISRYGYVDGIDHMKLQKLVYLVHGWWLAYHDQPVLSERPEVWRYGPVFPSLYHALKGFGDHPIRLPQRAVPFDPPPMVDDADDDVLGLIDWVWSRYGGYPGVRLSDITHENGTPWRTMAVRHQYRVPTNLVIPDALLKEYFRNEEAKRVGMRPGGGA